MESRHIAQRMAQHLIDCGDEEWPDIVHSLRENRQLYRFVSDLNDMLAMPVEQADLARKALVRMGLFDPATP